MFLAVCMALCKVKFPLSLVNLSAGRYRKGRRITLLHIDKTKRGDLRGYLREWCTGCARGGSLEGVEGTVCSSASELSDVSNNTNILGQLTQKYEQLHDW